MMKKIINLAMQTIAYFLIALFIFWIFRKIGVKTDSSMIISAFGLTIGWAIVKVGENIIRKRKQANN